MPFQRLRRALITAACLSPLLLAACGGGSVESEFHPSRVVVFGDASADAGQRGTRYTVNNGGGNWTEQLASRYGLTIAPSPAGTSFAIGSARVTNTPDASGNAATPTITDQIGTFLGAGAPAGGDLIVVSGGSADIIAEMAALNAATQTQAQTTANVQQAGRDLGAQVQRLVNAGASHILVAGPYNLGRSPWAVASGNAAYLQELSTQFNNELLISIVDLGAKVLYADAALYFNLVTSNPAGYGFTDVGSVLCTSVDAGAGIGIGAGRVNSALCNAGTLSGGPVDTTLFADPVYFTPAGHASFGNYAFDRVRERW